MADNGSPEQQPQQAEQPVQEVRKAYKDDVQPFFGLVPPPDPTPADAPAADTQQPSTAPQGEE